MLACSRVLKRAFIKKPTSVYVEEEIDANHHGLERKMGLFDLLMIGIGGTMGSGVFALAGLIAHVYSGPAVVCSFLIGGFSCLFSAASYGELSCRIPSAGSSYAYVYNCLGEYFAVISAWCLTLEYGISAAAVARNWGDKLFIYLTLPNADGAHSFVLPSMFDPSTNGGMNVFAGLLQLICVLVLMLGVDVSKVTINFFTIFKLVLIAFMIIVGFSNFDKANLVPIAPFGFMGIMKGATSCIFGLLGYDEVCCLAAEAKDPHRNLPIAVFGTIIIVSVFYCLAAFALVGMQPYTQISMDSGFTVAFESHNLHWAAQIVAIGELVCLPIVVLICFLAQPRFLFAMSEDGLMPRLFSELDSKGNLSKGIFLSGIICVVIALMVPFTYLDDMISAGVLFSFNLTNCSLIVTRKQDPVNKGQAEKLVLYFNLVCVVFAFAVASVDIDSVMGYSTDDIHSASYAFPTTIALVTFVVMCYLGYLMVATLDDTADPLAKEQYRVPFVPFTPLIGIVINYILIAQQSASGLLLMILYFVIATAFYVGYGSRDCEWKSNLLHATSGPSINTGSVSVSTSQSHPQYHLINPSETTSLLEMNRKQAGHANK